MPLHCRDYQVQFYAAELPHMHMLDQRFARYPNRCFDGSRSVDYEA